jgi:hypothetical protein
MPEHEKVAFCPNGCGTPLVRMKFVDAFKDEDKPDDVEEDWFCSKCCVRWVPEKHNAFLRVLDKPAHR